MPVDMNRSLAWMNYIQLLMFFGPTLLIAGLLAWRAMPHDSREMSVAMHRWRDRLHVPHFGRPSHA